MRAFVLLAVAALGMAPVAHQFVGHPALDAKVVACDAHLVPATAAGQSQAWQPGWESCPATMTAWAAAVAAIKPQATADAATMVKPLTPFGPIAW